MFLDKFDPEVNETLANNGLIKGNELQAAVHARFIAGGDAIVVAPNGAGKTTYIAVALINKLKEEFEDAPRAIVFVKDKDAALALQEQCKLLSKHTNLRFLCAFEGKFWKDQMEAIYIGADVVIGTIGRLQEIYFKNGLNMNKVEVIMIDNGEKITHMTQPQYERMMMSAPKKCKKFLFTTVFNDRLDRMTEQYLPHAAYIEAED